VTITLTIAKEVLQAACARAEKDLLQRLDEAHKAYVTKMLKVPVQKYWGGTRPRTLGDIYEVWSPLHRFAHGYYRGYDEDASRGQFMVTGLEKVRAIQRAVSAKSILAVQITSDELSWIREWVQ